MNVEQISHLPDVTAVILGILGTLNVNSVNVSSMAPEGQSVLLLGVNAHASRLTEANFVENVHKDTLNILIVQVCALTEIQTCISLL